MSCSLSAVVHSYRLVKRILKYEFSNSEYAKVKDHARTGLAGLRGKTNKEKHRRGALDLDLVLIPEALIDALPYTRWLTGCYLRAEG